MVFVEGSLEGDDGSWVPTFADRYDNPDQPRIDDIDTPLFAVTFCVVDLETTGTAHDSRITEIGAVKSRGGEILGEFQTLVNPGTAIPGFITALTGITNRAVAAAPPLREVFPSLIEFCRGCVMVAHNASFDMGFLLRAAKNLGYEWPSPTVLDTVTLARHIVPRREVPNYRLGTLAEFFGTAVTPSHRALDDARATVDVLHALFSLVGNQGVHTIEDLLQFSHTISRSRRAKHAWATQLPAGPGVYFFVRDKVEKRKYLYVGTSKQVRRRVATYFTASETRPRMEEMVALATGVEAIECATALEAAIVELRLIAAHQPPYNRRSKQPHHVWIKITPEPIPRFSIVRKQLDDHARYFGPLGGKAAAEQAVLALSAAFPLRVCKDKLSAAAHREPCALAELGACGAPCTGQSLPAYAAIVRAAGVALAGDVRLVRQACFQSIGTLSEQCRYEEAGETLTRFRVVEAAFRRQARLQSLAGCPQIVAARRVGDAWEIHVIRYGQLAAAAVAHVGDNPERVADAAVRGARTIVPPHPGAEAPRGYLEEAELVAAWMEQPGVRLLDIDGIWGWPVHAGAGGST
ncbi:MAG: DEDD exonuclease domain-containing protein [Propionibacteriaceae bacterium]|jgi:DNA polymerase-3 subunit epsilon|nr:DEDD exonuclease domain-containing protein [Propionibacteriaceae bacterium]